MHLTQTRNTRISLLASPAEFRKFITRRSTMAASSTAPVPPSSPANAAPPEHAATPLKPRWPWLKYATPLVVLLLAAAVLITLTRDWNSWEGGKIEQVTDDALVR